MHNLSSLQAIFALLVASALLSACASGRGSGEKDAAPTPATSAATDSAPSPELVRRAMMWAGPYGGVPPVDRMTPEALEAAFLAALEEKRREVAAIATNAAAPSFENTVAALDASGAALERAGRLLNIYTSTASSEPMRAIAARVLPLAATMDAEIAFNRELYARIDAVHRGLPQSAPTPQGRRLVEVTRAQFLRRGAALEPAAQARLKEMNARLAALTSRFAQNIAREEETLVVWIDDEAELAGLSDERRAAARAAAEKRDRRDAWAIPIQRPSVWPVLMHAQSRPLRERVFRAWEARGDQRGEFDNARVMREILQLRGEKARLFGFPSYAHYATAERMAGSPQVARAMLERAWTLLLDPTQRHIAELQAIADSDGANQTIAPWDRLYYAERLRQQRFALDADAVRPYLTLDNVMNAMMWAAGRTYELEFRRLEGVPVVAPDIRVYEVSRDGRVIGVLYADMFQRPGKGPSSWAAEYRTAQRGAKEVLPLVALHSAVPVPPQGGEPLLDWERANVIFHEFGHALHMLSNASEYRALGSTATPWDFIETPALLNERWLLDRAVLKRFARHYKTGEPMPDELIQRVERSLRHDRVFSLTLDYLATALLDMRVHELADGTREIDPIGEEKRLLVELGAPSAVTPLLRASHAMHTFGTNEYAAGVYTYLWSDVLAADIAEAFLAAPGGLFDAQVALRYRRTLLEAGATQPMEQAFREFRGRDPDPDALFRRFGLLDRAQLSGGER